MKMKVILLLVVVMSKLMMVEMMMMEDRVEVRSLLLLLGRVAFVVVKERELGICNLKSNRRVPLQFDRSCFFCTPPPAPVPKEEDDQNRNDEDSDEHSNNSYSQTVVTWACQVSTRV